MTKSLNDYNDDELLDLERMFIEDGLLNPLHPCELCGQETRNISVRGVYCEDCEELVVKQGMFEP